MPKDETPVDRKSAKIGELQLELDETNKRIEELEEQVGEMTAAYNLRHSGYNKDPWGDGKLPIPRLQFHYEDMQADICPWGEFNIHYSLVTRHFLGHIQVIPLGITGIGRGAPFRGPPHAGPFSHGNELYEAFRDGCHIVSDAKTLRLPAFKVFGDLVQEIALKPEINAGLKPIGSPYDLPRYGFETERLPENQVDEEEIDEDEEENGDGTKE